MKYEQVSYQTCAGVDPKCFNLVGGASVLRALHKKGTADQANVLLVGMERFQRTPLGKSPLVGDVIKVLRFIRGSNSAKEAEIEFSAAMHRIYLEREAEQASL